MVCRNFILPEFCKPCLFLFLRNLFYLIAQPSTTLDIYSHAFDKNKKLAQEKLAEAMGL